MITFIVTQTVCMQSQNVIYRALQWHIFNQLLLQH